MAEHLHAHLPMIFAPKQLVIEQLQLDLLHLFQLISQLLQFIEGKVHIEDTLPHKQALLCNAIEYPQLLEVIDDLPFHLLKLR